MYHRHMLRTLAEGSGEFLTSYADNAVEQFHIVCDWDLL